MKSMGEIEFSILQSTRNQYQATRELLDEFSACSGHHVHLTMNRWGEGWQALTDIAIYRHGPAISEVGATWLGSLAGMSALRPFEQDELLKLGGPAAFLPEDWRSGHFAGDSTLYGVPWFSDVSVLLYRRDLLAQAAIDERQAFTSLEAFHATLQRLQQRGVCAAPWSESTLSPFRTLQNLASWIWGCGGDFISDDGRRILFNLPEARRGFKAYFSLFSFIPKLPGGLSSAMADELFLSGQTAAILGDLTVLARLHSGQAAPEVIANLGAAIPPGVPSMGGSHLVIWNHAGFIEQTIAVQLAEYLTSRDLQLEFARRTHLLPARLDALDCLAQEPFFAPAIETLAAGRAFKQVRLWGLVEDRLFEALPCIWQDLANEPLEQLNLILDRHLNELANSLQLTLKT